ncbi:MAG: glycosyltransferase [Nitrospirae bacterium]|nr:glycosyltransferase [Nitrospirota bacterium]
MKPSVSIVIPAYNCEKNIGRTIEACLEQEYPNDKIEIIVVDDGSTDNTGSVAAKYPIKYIYQPNAGPAKARNTGWKNSQAEIVCFLDADCIPERKWIAKMITHYTREEIVCVGGRYGIVNEENLLARCIYTEFLVRYSKMPKFPKYIGSHGYSFRRSFLEKIGGYCEEYTMASGEDNDLAYRLLSAGYRPLFDQNIVIKHRFPTRIFPYLKVQFWHGYWRMKLYRDHPKMMKGDEYSTWWDFAQPPLLLSGIFLSPFYFFSPVRIALFVIFFLGILFQLPMVLSTNRRSNHLEHLFYIPLGFVRALFRGIGMFLGVLRFWIFRKQKANEFT